MSAPPHFRELYSIYIVISDLEFKLHNEFWFLSIFILSWYYTTLNQTNPNIHFECLFLKKVGYISPGKHYNHCPDLIFLHILSDKKYVKNTYTCCITNFPSIPPMCINKQKHLDDDTVAHLSVFLLFQYKHFIKVIK